MKTVTSTSVLLLAAGAAALTPNMQSMSLKARDDFCGTDQYGQDWSCPDAGTECCTGTTQGVCMPAGYNCCTTGYFCDPDHECRLDSVANIQYCVASGSSSDATQTADAGSAGSTGDARKTSDKSSSKSSDSSSGSGSSAALGMGLTPMWAALPVLYAAVIAFM